MDLKELTILCKRHFDEKTRLKQIEDALAMEKADLKKLEWEILKRLESAEIDKYSVPEIGTFSKRTQTSWNLPKDPADKKAYFEFLKEKGVYDSMISVNSRSHTSFCNAVMLELTKANPIAAANFQIPGVPGKNTVDLMAFRKG